MPDSTAEFDQLIAPPARRLDAVPELVLESEFCEQTGYRSARYYAERKQAGLIACFDADGTTWVHAPATERLVAFQLEKDKLERDDRAYKRRPRIQELTAEKLALEIAERRGELIEVEVAHELAVKFTLAFRALAEEKIVELAKKLADTPTPEGCQTALVEHYDDLVELTRQRIGNDPPPPDTV